MQIRDPIEQADEATRERLRKLLETRSQADIARATGVSLANVNRYVKGTRIPAGFCTAVINSLDVNPSWLMTGEGQPYVADITAGTVKMAGNVLELVEAMNSVAQMRLGALTGKHHLGVLRELDGALRRHEELRRRLNEQSAPIFSRLLDDLDKALHKKDMDQAADLRKAAMQVERLCNEPELSRRFLRLRVHHAMFEHDIPAAVEFQQKLAREPLTEGRMVSAEQCEDYLRLCLTLQSAGRYSDALRLCRAFVLLAEPEAATWPVYADMCFLEGSLLARVGRMREGMGLMLRWQPRMSGGRVAGTKPLLARHMIMAGLTDPREALATLGHVDAMLSYLTEVGSWIEDAALLKDVVQVVDSGKVRVVSLGLRRLESARCLAEALEKSDKKAVARLRDTLKQREPAALKDPGPLDDACAQIALAVGDKKDAAKYQARAREYHGRPETRDSVDVLLRALFLRNEIRLDPESAEAASAREELAGYVENGYWLLRSALA